MASRRSARKREKYNTDTQYYKEIPLRLIVYTEQKPGFRISKCRPQAGTGRHCKSLCNKILTNPSTEGMLA